MITGLSVLKTGLSPARTSRARALNSGPRWSIVGFAMARRTCSGDVCRPRDLKEVSSCGDTHICSFGGDCSKLIISPAAHLCRIGGACGTHQMRFRLLRPFLESLIPSSIGNRKPLSSRHLHRPFTRLTDVLFQQPHPLMLQEAISVPANRYPFLPALLTLYMAPSASLISCSGSEP